jgi:hypothetical protein
MINDDLFKGFEEISKHYTIARKILELAGVVSNDGEMVRYLGGRIEINASTKHMLLTIYFDNRANTGNLHWSQALTISSLGTVHYLSSPHLSESEAKEGRSNYRYIQWHTFLERELEKAISNKQSQ